MTSREDLPAAKEPLATRSSAEALVSGSAEGRLRSVIRHAPIVLLAVDLAGRITSLEGRSVELVNLGLGHLEGRAAGKAVFEICRDMPPLAAACRRALNGEDQTFAFDHARRHYDVRFEPLRGDGESVVGAIGVLIDVTEHRDAKAALQRSELQLAQADHLAALGSLAGGIAHQINNALTHMRLSLGRLVSMELARRPLTPVRMHRIELLQDIREGMGKVEHVIKELKNFSRIEDAPIEALDVSALLDSVLGLVAHEINYRARLTCDFGEVPLARGNARGLRQVFLNLLINASQSIPEGAAHLNEIHVATRCDGRGRVMVEIRDTGIGMPPEVLQRIFEPFFSTRLPGQGLGLGLSVCHDIVTAAGGEIEADSALRQGTTFRVILPANDQPVPEPSSPSVNATAPVASTPPAPGRSAVFSPSTEPTMTPPEPHSPSMPSDDHRVRILIVDDDRPVAAALALEFDEHDVVVAGSGREALQILGNDKNFDVIFCDLMMPEVTGMDVYEAIELVEPALVQRFVFMTGGAFTARSERFLKRIRNRCIDKPFKSEVLQAIVQRLTWRTQRESGGSKVGGRDGAGPESSARETPSATPGPSGSSGRDPNRRGTPSR